MAISKHDKQALADLFINMGVPLVVAIQTLESWSGGEAEPQTQRAEKLAKLLNISVDFATRITKKLEIRDAYTLENVRGRIIRIVTPIIADYYVKNGDAPSQGSLQGLTDLFDVLLAFADSVSPTDEKGSKPTKIATMVESCDPLLGVIREHNFDMPEGEVFREAVTGLVGRAEQLASLLGAGHAIESGLFRSVTRIYSSCYHLVAEKGGSFDDVWAECDQRLALIHGLTVFVADNAGISKGEMPVPVEKQPVPASGTQDAAPKSDPEETGAETEKGSSDGKKDGDDGDFNPMAFFSAGG